MNLIEKDLFSFRNGIARNCIFFGVDVSSSPHIDNKKKYFNFRKGSTQGLEHTLTAEELYSINVTKNNMILFLSLHCSGETSYLFVNGTETIKFKAKDSEVVAYPLCLGSISKTFSVYKMEKTELNGYVYDFSVDYNGVAVADILNIQKYLTLIRLGFLRVVFSGG